MYDRGHNTAGIIRQIHAISASGDRTAELRRLDGADHRPARQPPTRSPARPPAAPPPKAIPGARLRVFEGMGHDLPEELWPDFVEEIAGNAARAEGSAIAAPPRPPERRAGTARRCG